ncbi:FadR/GntR family transcriptional regulator [Mycobacterium sp. NPDC003449]
MTVHSTDSVSDGSGSGPSAIDRTIDAIRGIIASGEILPGQQLPTERDLAARLGVSRNTVREAVRALSLVNIVESRRGAGNFVTSLAPRLLLDSMSMLITLSGRSTVLDLLAVRRVLEAEATAQAAARIDADGLARLQECLDEMHHNPQSGDGDVEAVTAADVRFHLTIAEIAGNPVLAALLEALSDRTFRARVWRGYTQSGVFERAWDQHHAIFRALRDHDPAQAAAYAAAHVADVEAFLRESLPDGSGLS